MIPTAAKVGNVSGERTTGGNRHWKPDPLLQTQEGKASAAATEITHITQVLGNSEAHGKNTFLPQGLWEHQDSEASAADLGQEYSAVILPLRHLWEVRYSGLGGSQVREFQLLETT